MSVSVVIAAYNASPFIGRAIRSALAQPAVTEVVVIDDASTDDTQAAVDAFSRADPKVRLVRLPRNGGPAAARNAGFQAAQGEWIAVLDADDAFCPGRLERLLPLAQSRSADVVADNFFFYDASSASTAGTGLAESAPPVAVSLDLYLQNARPLRTDADWGLLKPVFRKAFLERNRLRYAEHSRHGEDFLFMVDLLLAGGRFVLDHEPGYLYTTRASGWSRTQVDYQAQVAQTASLGKDPRIAGDKRLQDLVRARMDAIARLSARLALADHRRRRDYAGLAALLIASGAARAVLVDKVKGKLWKRAR